MKKIIPYDPTKVKDVESALVALQGLSFQGRNLGNALELLAEMVGDSECFRVLVVSGAAIPAGMEEIFCQLIDRDMFHCIITTGANITHSEQSE